jgi:molecular chaperone GrpE (heat shock protein)
MMPIDNNNLNSSDPEPSAPATPETADLEQALAAEKKKAEECLNGWQRAQAEFINFKRRSEQERLEFNKFANASALLALLPVLTTERAWRHTARVRREMVEGVLVERSSTTAV